jgi:hypothetical protein
MLFWRCTGNTTCEVRRQKEIPKKTTETQKVAETEKTPEKTTAEKSLRKVKLMLR